MDLASRLQRELVRGSSVGLCAGAGPFDLPPGPDFAGRFLGTLQDQDSVDLLRDAMGGPTHAVVPGEISPDALVHLRTSGTTGEPKVRTLRWEAMLHMASLVNDAVHFGPGDSWGWCLPCDHIGGISVLVRALVASAVADPGKPADLVERCTHISLVPTQLRDLLDAGVRPSAKLRCALVGGASTPPAWIQQALDLGWPLYATWGATETAAAATVGQRFGTEPDGYAGHPLPGIQLSIDNGEVVACGPFSEHPIRTGDLGRLAEDGSLMINGRRDDGFTCGGHNVRPAAMQASLLALEGVRQAVVLAQAHPRWQNVPVAFLDGMPTLEVLDAFARDREPWSAPHAVYRLPEMGGQKPNRASLRDLLVEVSPVWRRASSGG
ncbi:MAG: AMP-binding protein [Planctomycetota bacterium]|nr:AMP-binding protein [Planctomycetota bacterium]